MAVEILLEDGLALYNIKLFYRNVSKDSPF